MTVARALLLDAVVKKCTHSILIFAGVAALTGSGISLVIQESATGNPDETPIGIK